MADFAGRNAMDMLVVLQTAIFGWFSARSRKRRWPWLPRYPQKARVPVHRGERLRSEQAAAGRMDPIGRRAGRLLRHVRTGHLRSGGNGRADRSSRPKSSSRKGPAVGSRKEVASTEQQLWTLRGILLGAHAPLAVVPVLVGPLQALMAMLPVILTALGGLGVPFQPSSMKRMALLLWAQKLALLVLMAVVAGSVYLGSLVLASSRESVSRSRHPLPIGPCGAEVRTSWL